MAHGARPAPRTPAPRPDITLARDCEACLGWGTLVRPDGHDELCPTCQYPTQPPPSATASSQRPARSEG
ncbi:hypothetical protein CLM62_17310 [Streptomyces sp. SA15]|nr:hypothetical protein CLM62_17310 [Streptomyces sp. SA15]